MVELRHQRLPTWQSDFPEDQSKELTRSRNEGGRQEQGVVQVGA